MRCSSATKNECLGLGSGQLISQWLSTLDAALEDDDAAIRALNNNIDASGTGILLSRAVKLMI